MSELRHRTDFYERPRFCDASTDEYSILPFFFHRVKNNRVLLTNDFGDFLFLNANDFTDFVSNNLNQSLRTYQDLKAKHFLSDGYSSFQTKLLASQLRTRKSFLDGFSRLHIFVVSLRCDHSCPYCQVSRQSADRLRYDMTQEIAERSVELALSTPNEAITIEFQGGEALLNFEIVRHIVEYAKERNRQTQKQLSFVICTNLSTLSNEHLDYCANHEIKISTSLDGPKVVHDRNRPFGRTSSYDTVIRNVYRVKEALGRDNLSALMTTTRHSLSYPTEIVDEYVRHDLGSIFLRPLSPYGFAVKTWKAIGYPAEDFIQFYKRAFDHILTINRDGNVFPEAYATLLLQKILSPFPGGYVDLRSPTGVGFGVTAYNYDGDVYASDESRMLAEMHDRAFRLGNVLENSYEEIFFGETMQDIAAVSCNEALAGCADCVFQPYCGADPLYHYATQDDMYGRRYSSGFCKRNTAILSHLFDFLDSHDREIEKIFWAWINATSFEEMDGTISEWQSD